MTFTNVLENLSIAKQEVTPVFNDAEEVGNWGKQIESKQPFLFLWCCILLTWCLTLSALMSYTVWVDVLSWCLTLSELMSYTVWVDVLHYMQIFHSDVRFHPWDEKLGAADDGKDAWWRWYPDPWRLVVLSQSAWTHCMHAGCLP